MRNKDTDHGPRTRLSDPSLSVIRGQFAFSPCTGHFFRLSKEGGWILEAILAGKTDAEIESGLMDRYGVNHGTAVRDLEQFQIKLTRLGLVSKPEEH